MGYFIWYVIFIALFLRGWYVIHTPKKYPHHDRVKFSCLMCDEKDLSYSRDGKDWKMVDLNGHIHNCKMNVVSQ